jgi:hypothetical protein
LRLAEEGLIVLIVSEQVIVETERALAAKAQQAVPYYREALRATGLRIVADPSKEEVEEHKRIISDESDVPIIVAAMSEKVDFLVTLNRRHFIDDPGVIERSGLRIGTPGDALEWIRSKLMTEEDE